MKKINLLMALAIMAGLLLVAIQPAQAQAAPGQIVWINKPISSELRDALDAWLASPPSSAVYYAVTYTQPIGEDYYATMVGLNIQNPDDPWSFTGLHTVDENGAPVLTTQVIWIETIRVSPDGSVTYPFRENQTSAAFKLSMPIDAPSLGAGGGSYVRFPWQPSKVIKWSLLGVHGGGDLADEREWRAMDWASGSDMGSGAANDQFYASVGGQIEAVCDDGTSVAILVEGNGDSFIYGNLKDNANLVLGHSFSAGQSMGSVIHGAFFGACGNAIQQDDRWSGHWGFVILNNTFKAEGCILSNPAGAEKWHWTCGNTVIQPNSPIYHYGNVTPSVDPGTLPAHAYWEGPASGGGPSFWDYFIEGAKGLFDELFLSKLPEHESANSIFINSILNGVKIVFRIVNVLIRGNLNLVPAATVVVIAITINLGLGVVTLAGYVIRIIKSIPFIP